MAGEETILKEPLPKVGLLYKIYNLMKSQIPEGFTYPMELTVTDKFKKVEPLKKRWRHISIYNTGPNTCKFQYNDEARLGTDPIVIEKGVTKNIGPFPTDLIHTLYFICDEGESATLEIELTR